MKPCIRDVVVGGILNNHCFRWEGVKTTVNITVSREHFLLAVHMMRASAIL